MDGQASRDGRSATAVTLTPAQRAHRQRASVAAPRVSHAPTFSTAGQGITTMRGSGGQGDAGRTRRGSIRHAVRKIFGRSSRDVTTPRSPYVSAPVFAPVSRHVYHKSEPTAALPHQHVPELPQPPQDDDVVPQTILTTQIRAKTSSPYAVSFPKSVMLKPMNLGNPFVHDPGQMKRRKTMPSTGLSVRDAVDAAASVPVPDISEGDAAPLVDDDRHTRRAVSQIKKARRKSRSTDDLVAFGAEPSPHRKRSDEIRYWRESFQPDVLRASGFTTTRDVISERFDDHNQSSGQDFLEDGEQTPVPPTATSSESARVSLSSRSSLVHHEEVSNSKEESRPSSPLELSKDLEQRVLKLEAGLNNFQRSLERMTADRNRRTIVLQSTLSTRRSSNDVRTPSMLADTLVDPLEPSSYEYEYGRTMRPSVSPKQLPLLQSRTHFDDSYGPPTPRSDHYADSVRLPTPPHSRSMHSSEQPFPSLPASLPPSSADSSRQQQNTFHSVYQMLSDERLARQKLESQLKRLQQEISDLHAQVNVTSQRPNDRNSHMLVGSSARLQQLLQETEEATAPKRTAGQSKAGAPVASRFSGSESETGFQEPDEAETPYGAYLTPREERSAGSLADRQTHKDDDLDCMF